MSITLDLKPDLVERLEHQAAARGVPVPLYVESLIREAVESVSDVPVSLSEFKSDWEAFRDGLDNIEPLAPEALTREAIYGEHD